MGGTIRTCAVVRNVCLSSEENLQRRDNLAALGVGQSVI
jgi:hypothetical protein